MRFASMIAGFMFAAFIYGCATDQVPAGFVAAPPLVTYSPAFEHEAAQELRKLPNSDPLAVMVTDYLKLRCALRWVKACNVLVPNRR